MEAELRKLAADAIIQLQGEILEKTAELELYHKASDLAFKLFKKGAIAAEDIETSIEKFASGTLEELNLIDKAIEFNASNGNTKFGTVSSKLEEDGLDPLTRYLLSEVS
jgi:hypothetical protein